MGGQDQRSNSFFFIRAISAASLGDSNAWKYLLEALLIADEAYTEMELHHIHFYYSDDGGNVELFVNGTTDIWNQTQVEVAFVFYLSSGVGKEP